MIIMAVDNHLRRLRQLAHCLKGEYPVDTVIEFADPFRAIQYLSMHKVSMVFVDSELRPFDASEFSGLATGLCSGIKVYLVTGGENAGMTAIEDGTAGMAACPFTQESLQFPVKGRKAYLFIEENQV